MLFGGFFNNLEFSPAWLDWVKHISWYKYSTEIFLADQWEGYLVYCPIRDGLRGNCVYRQGEDVLEPYSIEVVCTLI